MRTKLLVAVLLLSCSAVLVIAGTTGKITGKVTDKKTGAGLPGVTIRLVQNPKIGGITRPTGEFNIMNVPAGEYTVRATAMGYESTDKTGIRVSADATVEVSFKLGTKVMEGKDTVVVIAERNPTIDPGRSTTKRQFTEEQIKDIPRETVQGFIALTPGVTVDATNGGFSIRGGRSTETSVRVDGMEITNLQQGALGTNASFYPTVPTLGVEEVQVVSGGFAAEYGHALSGIVNTVTKEGRADKYEGEFKYKTNLAFMNGISNSGTGLTPLKLADKGENLMEFGFGGPVPGVDGLRFYLSGMGDMVQHRGQFYSVSQVARLALIDPNGNNVGLLPNDRLFIRTLNGKFTWDVSSDVKLSFTAFQGATFYELGRWQWLYADDTSLVSTPTVYGDQRGFLPWSNGTVKLPEYLTQVQNVNQINQNFAFRLNQTLNKSTVYELGVGYFGERTDIDKKNLSGAYSLLNWNGWNLYGRQDDYTGDVTTHYVDKNNTQLNGPDGTLDRYYDPRPLTSTGTKRVQNAITGHYEGYIDVVPTHNAYGVQNVFYATGDENLFQQQSHAYYQVDGNVQSQLDDANLFKAGFEGRFLHELNYQNPAPWDQSVYIDQYDYHPFDANFFLQDKAEYSGLVITPGVRFDYFAPNSYYPKDPNDYDPYYAGNPKWVKAETKFQVSPRFGVAYNINERTQFHVSYGWFFQIPSYDQLFTSLGINTSTNLGSVIGNPNLNAQKTKAYEFGLSHSLSEDIVMEFTGYYKDQYSLNGTTQYSPLSAVGTNSVAYTYYTTGEYANQRGIEITLRKNLSNNYSVVGNVTLSQAMGTSSSLTQSRDLSVTTSPDPYLGGRSVTIYPTTEYPMDYDRSITGNVIAGVVFAKNEGPSIGGIHFLENFNFNLTTVFQSGTPYTRVDRKTGLIAGPINGERNPSWWQSDMRIERTIPLKEVFGESMGTMSMSLYLDILNVFDRTQALYYYPRTGTPDDDGSTVVIGNFDQTPWAKDGAQPNEVDQYKTAQYPAGRPLYNVNADVNKDGQVDQLEKLTAFQTYRHDYLSRRLNYQIPREVFLGVTFRF